MDGLSLTPAAFWLLPVVLAALFWIRFLRGRRQEVVAGSLLLWRSLAALQPVNPPRRFPFDRSLILQALALVALVAALARPEFSTSTGGRTVVIAVDNGPLARFRSSEASPLWNAVSEKTRQALDALNPADRVVLIRAAPFPKLLSNDPVSPAEARKAFDNLLPALSGPDPEALFAYARNAARSSNTQNVAVFSASAAPSMADKTGEWICTGGKPQGNVGIVAFGAVTFAKGGKESLQGLLRIHNAAADAREVSVRASQEGGRDWTAKLQLSANSDDVMTLDEIDASRTLRVTLTPDDGLLEDNSILIQPRKSQPVRIRYHAKLPAIERLFATALLAESVPAESSDRADIDVYSGAPPQQLSPDTRAVLLVEPTSGYRFFFDIGDATLTAPIILRDEPSPLTANFKGGGETGLFPVARAVEILRTGSYTSLLKNGRTQRTLAARFVDERGRTGYVLAFSPGAGSAPDALLPDELSALLIRMARDASGRAEPFNIEKAADWEARNDDVAQTQMAVLDSRITSLQAGAATTGSPALLVSSAAQKFALRPWLILLGLLLLTIDFLFARATPRPVSA